MNKPLRSVVFSLMLLSPAAAVAQTPPPAMPAARATPAPAAPAVPQELPPPPADAPPPVDLQAPPPVEGAVPAPTLEDRVGELSGKVEGMDESLAATKAIADKLNKIKVSGYVQGRFEYHADSANGVNAGGTRTTTTQFLVRRGRLKTVYEGTNAEYLLQIDATGSGVTLKDAEATFVDTWTPLGLRLTAGQFKWPFGYEVLQSSGDREMPERSLMIRRLFPGERDRGLRLTGKAEWFRFALALVNGTGTQDATYPANDNNAFKDVVGRVGGDFGFLVGGLSGYIGRSLGTKLTTTMPITGTDKNMDGAITPDELTIGAATTTAAYTRFRRMRVGADLQAYFDIPEVGGLALKGEFIYALEKNLSYGATAANKCLDVHSLGWIVTGVLNVGDYVGLVARYDAYDPNFSKALDSSCTAQITTGQGDRVDTVGGGVLLYASGNVKGTFIYEHVAEQSNTKKNDVFTAQIQARF
jgi:hypothetical protein